MQLQIELTSLRKEKDAAAKERREAIERELAELKERSDAMKAAVAEGEGRDPGRLRAEGAPRAGARGSRARRARSRPAARRRAALRRDPRAREASSPSTNRPSANSDGDGARRRCSSKRRSTPTTSPRSSRAGPASPSAGCSRAKPRSCPHGGAPARTRRRPGRGDRGGRHRAAPLARRPAGPRPPDRLVPVPRPDRRRQDRARARARRVHVRLTGRDDPHRHVRVHGETLRLAARRRAPGLRRLRRGRPADRGGAPPPLLGRAARRDREGPRGRVQHAAAGDGRRPPHRRPGPHRRLQEHRADHDLEPPVGDGSGSSGRSTTPSCAPRCSSTSSPSSSTASTTSCASSALTREQISEIVELQVAR